MHYTHCVIQVRGVQGQWNLCLNPLTQFWLLCPVPPCCPCAPRAGRDGLPISKGEALETEDVETGPLSQMMSAEHTDCGSWHVQHLCPSSSKGSLSTEVPPNGSPSSSRCRKRGRVEQLKANVGLRPPALL